jgi:hypothetical protein
MQWWPHVATVSDERQKITTYTRDPTTHLVTRIDYPADASTPASYEAFTYNINFGQVLTHRLRNGAWESFVYDGRGLLTDKYNPKFDTQGSAPGGNDPHTHYDYYTANDPIGGNDWIDRVKTVTLPANVSGYAAADTYEYDKNSGTHVPGRGLITKIIHNDATHTYKSFGYDAYGNKLWEENELGNHTSYTYDDYNPVIPSISQTRWEPTTMHGLDTSRPSFWITSTARRWPQLSGSVVI